MMIKLPQIFSNRQFKWIATVIAAVALIYLTINIFLIGGDVFVYYFNSLINPPLAIINAVSAISIWRLMSAEKHNRLLWSGLLIGWGLWALAETIWTIYSILGQEVPYPSLADFFWVIGYIPLGIGLIFRIRSMPTRQNQSQNMFILGFSAFTILITAIFIFIPTIKSFDPQQLIQSILNLIYPLADLFVVIIVWRLLFAYEEGDFGFGWKLLNLGFILMTISDLLYIFISSQGLYYPDMKANVLSRLVVDAPYTISILLWIAGVHALRILLKKQRPIEPIGKVRMVRTYGHILIYTKGDDAIINVSPNFNRFFRTVNVKGKTLAEALSIPKEDTQTILNKIRVERRVNKLPIQVHDLSGVLQQLSLNGMATFDTQNDYTGANILLRMRVADPSFDEDLGEESRSMASYLLGSDNQTEIMQFLSDYYRVYIKSLVDMAFHQGGEPMSQALLDRLRETAQMCDWQMQFNLQTIMDSEKSSLKELREALPILLETAKQFVSEIMDPAAVEARIQEVSSQFSEAVQRDLLLYRKAGNKTGFSDHRKASLDE